MKDQQKLPKTPPTYLDDTAKVEYKRIQPLLDETGAGAIDLQAVVGYCQSVSLWRQAQQELKKNGSVIVTPTKQLQISPWHSVYKQQMELVKKFIQELGASPAARKGLTVSPNDDETPESIAADLCA